MSRKKTHNVRKPLIFISHDARDAELAAAFAKLLQGITGGAIESFRSSDSGGQNLHSGVEWYGEIMKNLGNASDVVCLLTPRSYRRPWIYYEAGYARGPSGKPVHGLVVGLPRQKVTTAGPFSQIQLCSADTKELGELMLLLAGRAQNCSPEPGTVRLAVTRFLKKAKELVPKGDPNPADPVRLHHASLPVRNLERSVAFYRDVLGFVPTPRPADLLFRLRGAWFNFPNGEQQLHLIENPNGTFRRSRAIDFNDCHFAVRVTDVGAARRRVRAARKRTKRNDDIEDNRYPHFYVLDPDLHVIEVNGDKLIDRTLIETTDPE